VSAIANGATKPQLRRLDRASVAAGIRARFEAALANPPIDVDLRDLLALQEALRASETGLRD
jgi:hypothetical protein